MITILAWLMLLGGLWAFIQSRSGTQWPVPIAVAGFAILMLMAR